MDLFIVWFMKCFLIWLMYVFGFGGLLVIVVSLIISIYFLLIKVMGGDIVNCLLFILVVVFGLVGI